MHKIPAISSFLNHLEYGKLYSKNTIRNYAIDLNQFFERIQYPIETITRREIRTYLAHLNQTGLSKKTAARHLSALRTFFKWAERSKLISSNPCEEIESPKIGKQLPSPLTFNQVEQLMQAPDIETLLGLRDRAMMELLYSSGLRVGELVSLNLTDFHFPSLLMKIRGKGKKERVIPFTYLSKKWLEKYLDHPERPSSSAVFLNRFGTRLTTRSVDRLFKGYLKQCHLPETITPHTVRHTIATHWLEMGMDLEKIKTLLGHASLVTTTIYTQVSSSQKREVYEKAHPRNKNLR